MARLAAADSALWQLTFTYNAAGLQLVKAAEIPPSQKRIVTPGLEGAEAKLDYDLIWENAAGQVIASSAVVIPLGLRGIFSEQTGEHSRGIPAEGGFVLRVTGPDPGAGPVTLRLVKRVARANAAPADAPQNIPPVFGAEEHQFALPLAMARGFAAAAPDAGPISAIKLRDSGPDNNRLVVVIMCDGFTEADLATSSFSNTVSRFLGKFFTTPPWNSYAQGVNIYRVDIASNQSGADYEDAAPGSGGTLKDTYLNAAFWVGGTERCLFLTGDGISRASAAADSLVGVGVWDEILVFVNSTKYGGCGGSVGVSSLNSSADEVQIHEFGHSFAGLADEYDYGSSGTNCSPSSTRNIDCPINFPSVKWDVWVNAGTPIPTPETSAYANTVGAFEGGGYQTIGIYRPMLNCKMQSLGVPFCPICSETHIMRLLDRVALADSVSPPAGAAEVPRGGTAQFVVNPLSVSPLTYRWELGGVTIPGATSRAVPISGSDVTMPNQELKVIITHNTPQVRAVVLQDTYTWRLNLVDSPSSGLNNVTLAEPTGAPASAIFTVALSFAASELITVDYYVGGGTATPGADYTPQVGRLTFAPGQRTNIISVPILPDALPEPPEFFFVNLFNASDLRIGDGQGTGLILDDDNPPTISITNPAPLSVFSEPANVFIEAGASDADGSVTNIDLFEGATLLTRTNGDVLNFVWTGATRGVYTLQAIAMDNSGRRATSGPVKIAVSPPVPAPVTLVALDAPWKFDATTIDYGAGWKDPGFLDDAWEGPAPALFYNETATLPGPMNTPLPLTYNAARIRSFYFRTTFNLPFPAAGISLVSSNVIDDGAVFWLNGTEVGRLRMAGVPTRTTLASGQPPGSDATALEGLIFPTTSLVEGDNVLAVEVHQQSDTSSDMAFGTQLDAVFGYAPFFIDDTLPADRFVTQGRPLNVSVQVAALPPPRYQWYRNDVPLNNATNPTYTVASMTSLLAGQYFCRVSNQLGSVDSRIAEIDYVRDLQPPGLVYAYGQTNGTTITVWFSEGMLTTDAIRITNYSLSPPLTIISAGLLSTTNVTLNTAARTPGMNYLLTVNYLRDRYSNAIPANSQIPVATEMALVLGDRQPWHYFQSDTAPDPGWVAPGFDESVAPWALGEALFDAKRPPRSTVPPNNDIVRTMLSLTNPPTAADISVAYYFRTHFRFPGPSAGARLFLRTLVDDGAVYYLNGREVLRLGMPPFPAPISYYTFANRSQGDTQTLYEGPFAIPADALVEGDNVLCAEVHQANLASSDISFAAQLTGHVPGIRPFALAISVQADQAILTWDDATSILQQASAADGPWQDVLPPPASPYAVNASDAARFYRLRTP